MRELHAVVTLLALLASSSGGPISSQWDQNYSQCATKCIASQKFRYARGTTYEFDYLAQTATSMEDASEDTARLSIAATALVNVISDCDMVLELRDITVQESDPKSPRMRNAPDSARAAAELGRQPLRFSFQDGVVDELCPSEQEELWALNVKRGVLSAFQNSMSRLDSDQTVSEVDVAGRCPAQYQVQNKGWYSTTVKRSKDLLACTDRHDYQTAVTASPYLTSSTMQSLPLIKSSHECQQTVDQNGILSSATCTETHQFRPFSREASGSVTKVSQSLKFKRQSRSSVNMQPVSQRVSLMYDHGSQEEVTQKAREEAEQVLRQLCQETQKDIRPDTPLLFSSLVSALRRVDSGSLQALDSSLQQNTLCAGNTRARKFFVDALPMAGSDATIAMMTRMLINNEVTGLQADMWLTSLALIQEPSEAMLEEVKGLLKSPTLGQKTLLPVSTMLNNLCQRQSQCSDLPAVQTLMTALTEVIPSSCYVSDKNLEQVLMGLRAIGNAGHVSSAVQVVNKCVSRSRNPMEIRVAAAQAFRRMPCDADRSAVTAIMEDKGEDSELRVTAYLAVMTCPDDNTLRRVQRLLESETDQQMGSFVWSHLSNLQETSSPHKQAVRQMLSDVKLPAKFDLGRLQFSRNYEGSAFLQRLNSGASAESNLVWSSSSSLPRSLSANLTVDLFGHSLNLLDLGLRLEGLEYLMETVLGPYGYFGQEGKSKGQLDEVKGWLYLRMLGNEMTFQRFQGINSFPAPTSFNMLDFLIKLSDNHQVSMTKSMELLDTSLTVPTSCGLPLALTVKSTATVDLQASGNLDLKQLSASPRTLHIDGEIRPSGSIQVSGEMSVDAQVSRAALRVTGTLHSSSALKARMDLDRGRILSMELDVPEEKMELLDISSEFSILHNTVEKKQQMITENRQSMKVCTGEAASRLTGLELCGELQFPNASTKVSGPYFPFTGPSRMSLTLYKRDTHTGYKLMAKNVENKKMTMAQLSFNTPGSSVDRSLAFDLVVNREDRQLQISAASPWKKAEFKGGITATKKAMGVSGSFITDDVNVYALTTEVIMDESKSGVTYMPRVEIRRPGSDDVALTGTVSMESSTATVDLSLTGLTARPWTLKSALTNTQKEVSLTGSIANGDKEEYSVRVGTQISMAKKSGKFQVDPFLSVKTPSRELVSFTGSGVYTDGKVIQADMTFTMLDFKPINAQLMASQSGKASVRYATKASVKSSLVSGSAAGTVSIKKGRMASGRASVSYSISRSIRDSLELVAKLSDRSTKAYNKYTLQSTLESKRFPDYNTAVKMNVDHKKKLTSMDLDVQYGSDPKDKSRRLALSGNLARNIRNLYDVDLSYKMAAEAPQQNIDFKIQGSHLHNPEALESSVDVSLDKKKAYSAALTLGNKSGKLTNLNGELTLKAPGADLNLQTALNQVSKKQWEHSGSLRTSDKKHSINTVYQNRGVGSHQVTSTLAMQGFNPMSLSGDVDLDPNDMRLGASFQHGQDNYAMSGSQKMAKSQNGKWSLEINFPSRRMTLTADAGKVKDNYEGSLEAAWDADRDPNAKVVISGMASSKSTDDYSSHKARLAVSSPLKALSQVEVSVGLDSSASQHKITTRLVTGNDQITTSTLVVATPISLGHLEMDFKAETPFSGYRTLGMSLNHNLDDGLNTKLTLSLQKDQCDVSLTARSQSGEQSRDLNAQLDVRSTMGPSSLRSVSVVAGYKASRGQMDNSIKVTVNKDLYSYSFHTETDSGRCNGDLTLIWPQDQMKTMWTHRHTSSEFSSTITSTWSSNQRMQVDVAGAHVPGSFSGSLALQHPAIPEWRAEMNTQYGSGRLVTFSSVKVDSRERFAHGLTVTADASKTDMDFSMTSPWTDPMSGKLNAKYSSFPMTASAEFSWAPRQKVTAEGSVILNNWDDLDISLRLTTHVKSMRTLAASATSKVQGSEVVGDVNVDLGMRENVMLSTRVQRDLSGVRVKMTTPWTQLQVLDAGLETSIQAAAGKVKVDFKAMPVVGQYEALATWAADNDLSARLRLDTPLKDFPYIQILASSKEKRRARQSHLELEYSPSQIFSLDSTYSFDMPLVLDVNVATPINGYESLSAALRTNMKDTAWDASAQVTYTNDKVIKATAAMSWSAGLDTSLTVVTPFAGWENNWAVLQYRGEMTDFSSNVEVTIGGMSKAGASLKFQQGDMKTDAQLTITTPLTGWEQMEATVSRKGDLTNLRGSAIVQYSGQKMEANVVNKWNDRKARMQASLSTPYTQDLKMKWEHSPDLQAKGSLSYGNDYSLDTSSSALWDSREMSASTKVQFQVGGPRHELMVAAAKVGSLADLSMTASASLDQQEISMTAQLSTVKDLKASMSVKTPFSPYESLGASFSIVGDMATGMTTEVRVEYMTNRNINSKLELSFPDLSLLNVRGSLTSDLHGLERSIVTLSHTLDKSICKGSFNLDTSVGRFGMLDASYQMTGYYNSFKAQSQVNYNSQSLLDASLAHRLTTSRLQSSLRMLTSALPELNMEVDHQGDMSRFTTKASASFGADKMSSFTRWMMTGDNMDLSQSLESSLQGDYNQATIMLSKVGPLSDVTLQLSANVNAQKAKVIGKLTTTTDLSASLQVESPFDGYSQLGASFRKTGDSRDMSITAAANLQRQKIEMVGTYTQDNEVKGSLDITTPFRGYKQMRAAFSYGDENAMISGNVQNDKIEATGRFVRNDGVDGSVEVTTPFSGYRQMGVSFNYAGKNAKISGNLENQKIEATSRFANDDSIEGDLNIKTPFDGYRYMGVSFNHDGQNAVISGNLEGKKVEATGRFTNIDAIEATADVTTPFDGFSKLGASFSYDGQNFKMSGNLEDQRIEAAGKYVNDDTVEGSLNFMTPFDGFKQLGASLSFDGQNVMLSGNLEDQKIEATGRFVNDDATEGSFNVKTPFEGYQQMGASFQNSGKSMTAAANLLNDKIEASAKFDNTESIMGSVEINTPFSGYTQLGGQFRFSGDLSDLTMTTSGNMESSKLEMTAKFSQGQDVSGSVRITTPFLGYQSMGSSFTMSGDLSDMTMTADAFLQREKLQARAAFSSKEGISGSVNMDTPFQGFQQLEAAFKHTGRPSNFNTEGHITFMDGQTITGKVNFLSRQLRRIETSAELTTPFRSWEKTQLSYKHAGNSRQWECNAQLDCSIGQHTADLKVDWSKGQDVQLTVKTPIDGFRMTELTHSLSQSSSSVQWSGALTYGQGQRASSHMSIAFPEGSIGSTFDLQTPFTSDVAATFDLQGDLFAHTRKTTVKYGSRFQLSDQMEFYVTSSPSLLVSEVMTYTLDDVTSSQSISVRRDGPWNDVTLAAKGQLNGDEVAVNAAFKNDIATTEASVKVNTPFEGYNDVGASWRHVGEMWGTFSTEGKVEYMDGQEIVGKLDWTRSTWQRLQATAELTTPFDDWTQTRAEYRHKADSDGLTGSVALNYLDNQRLTGDLRVTTLPQPEVTLTVKTPWSKWEQLSATGSYQNDGWGKREMSGKVDLGQGYVYTTQTALSTADHTKSFTSRLTTPHADWNILEARASQEGSLDNFKTTAFLSTPLLNSVSASASVRYTSLFDLTAAASLNTPFEGAQGWKFEMVNGDRGSQKTSHVMVGWSGDQEMVLDGTWRHDNSFYERHLLTDLTLSTPFEAVRRSSWLLEHHATQGKYVEKVTGSLNGDKVAEVELSTETGDLPKVTLTLSEPYAMQYSASRTSEGADVMLDWDRNDPNSNVALTSRFTASSDDSNTQHDLDIKMVNPSLMVGAKYNLQVSQISTASQGELYWGRGGNRRVFYNLEMNDLSRLSTSSYGGKMKVGAMSRAVQLSAAVSQSPMSRQMDATLHWDAEGDLNKHVSLQTSWTSGTKNKADVTLKLPSINQEVHVQSEVALNQGRTLLEATTALSFSPESSKVLTFTSTLKDTTGGWDNEGSNYTLQLSLTHPHTDLDLALTSHLGASQNRYSAAVDTWYLTTGRQRHNMALRGEIDQLRRQLTMEMVSPMKKVVVKGQVKSVEPYSLSLTNRYDDDATIQADVTFDTSKRSFSVKTNYDLEHPERTLVLKAFYVNDTAVRAEVYRDYVNDVTTDALLALRLNTSTLLHSRLHWRPESFKELQDYTITTLTDNAQRMKETAHSSSAAVQEELSARWARTMGSMTTDLQPWMDFVTSEMGEVTEQLTNLRRQINRLARRYPMLQDQLNTLQEYLGEVSVRYQQTTDSISQQMKEAVQTLTQYPVGEYYQQTINTLLTAFEDMTDMWLEQLTEAVMSVDSYLLSVKQHGIELSNSVSEAVNNMTGPHIMYLKDSLDFTPYMQEASNRVSAVSIPVKYTAPMYRASAVVRDAMSDVMNMESMKQVREASNKVYQQGVWAYNYWDVEENLKKHLQSIATLLKEIIQEEMDIYSSHFRFLQESHVTVWDPEHGEVQAELRLPVTIETMDSMPDMTPLVNRYNDVMKAVPDVDTVQYFYNNYVPQSSWWSTDNKSKQNESSAPVVVDRRRNYRQRGPVQVM